MKLEINYKKKPGKFTNMWRLNNMLLNNQWVKEEIKQYFEAVKMEILHTKTYGMQQKQF